MNTPDFNRLFERSDQSTLVVIPKNYTIVACTDAYLKDTQRTREQLIGKPVFEAFPDVDNASIEKNGRTLKESFEYVLTHKVADEMGVHRYSITKPVHLGGEFETRYWRTVNHPLLDENQNVEYIRHIVQDVTAEVLAEDAINDSKFLQRLAGDVARLGSWSIDLKSYNLFWSKEVYNIVGVPLETTPTLDLVLNCYHPDFKDETTAAIEKAIKERKPFNVLSKILRPDNEERWVRVIGEVELDVNGEPKSLRGAFQDVTEFVEAEHRADNIAIQLHSALENMSDGFVLLSKNWSVVFLNPQAEKLLERSAHELIGNNLWDEFPEAVDSDFYHCYKKAVDEQVTVRFTEYYPPLKLWFQASAYPSKKGLAVYFRDITEDLANEKQLRLLRAAVERQNDMVVISEIRPNAPTTIVYVNAAFVRDTGFSKEEALGSTTEFLYGPETQQDRLAAMRNAFSRSEPYRVELISYRKNGDYFWIDLDTMPLFDSNGKHTHTISVARDISKQKAFDERLRQSQKLEAVGHLTGGVSHDFNNLLTVIMGNAELISEQLDSQSGLKPLADLIVKAAGRGADLTQRLLAFSRRQPLEPQAVNVAELINGMQDLIKRTLSESMDIDVLCTTKLWRAEADPSQLEAALLNLVINARDAMPAGGKLLIEAENALLDDDYAQQHQEVIPGEYVLISVSDNGEGMGSDVLEKAFEPFYTTKPKGKGSGLGLSMVYGFTKQSGGHIRVYSEVGEGTTVKIYLPRTRDTEEVTENDITDISRSRGHEHILVVEDDELVLESVLGQLQRLGYKVTSANSGEEAYNWLQKNGPVDLLFTDVVMPGKFNGPELAKKANKLFPSLKVLFTSGYTENTITHNGRLDRGVHLLSKPYHRQALAEKIRYVLDLHK